MIIKFLINIKAESLVKNYINNCNSTNSETNEENIFKVKLAISTIIRRY